MWFYGYRHPVQAVVLGRPEAFVPGCRPAHHPTPHRGMRPAKGAQGNPYNWILCPVRNGAIR